MRTALWMALPAALAFGVWEVRRWKTPLGREMINARQCRLRTWGLIFLLLTLGLWLRGTYLPIPHPRAKTPTPAERQATLDYIGYWTLTALCALPLFPLALLDTRENLRRLQAERAKLTEERTELVQDFILKDSANADPSSSSKPAP